MDRNFNAMRRLKKMNDKEEKKLGGTYLWDVETASAKILNNMINEAGKCSRNYYNVAPFLALRLKFSNDEVRSLVLDALTKNLKHYNHIIDGEKTLHETMKHYNCDYYTAIFAQYIKTEEAVNSGLPDRIVLASDVIIGEIDKVPCSEVTEDGHHLNYLTLEEYHAKYGLTEKEKLNQPMSEKDRIKFEKARELMHEERAKWEKRLKKPARKWNEKTQNEFREHLDKLEKEMGIN